MPDMPTEKTLREWLALAQASTIFTSEHLGSLPLEQDDVWFIVQARDAVMEMAEALLERPAVSCHDCEVFEREVEQEAKEAVDLLISRTKDHIEALETANAAFDKQSRELLQRIDSLQADVIYQKSRADGFKQMMEGYATAYVDTGARIERTAYLALDKIHDTMRNRNMLLAIMVSRSKVPHSIEKVPANPEIQTYEGVTHALVMRTAGGPVAFSLFEDELANFPFAPRDQNPEGWKMEAARIGTDKLQLQLEAQIGKTQAEQAESAADESLGPLFEGVAPQEAPCDTGKTDET